MSADLARQLIEQAEFLARKEPKKPKDASLRRAVSAAYYALFHFLIDKACRRLVGTAHELDKMRKLLSRAFQHAEMKKASKTFAGGTLPSAVSSVLGPMAIPSDLRTIAASFVKLQEERHRADYNLADAFTRPECRRLISEARNAMTLWNNIANDTSSRLYLVCLLTWGAMVGR